VKANRRILRWLALLALAATTPHLTTVFAQGTAFSYQGRLNDGGSPATGIYDLRFTVCDSADNSGNVIAGPVTNDAVAVSNGLFSVALDFGPGVFTGSALWLQVDVQTNGAAEFTPLLPRQPILPVPYAVMANSASNLLGTLPAAQLSGTLPAAQLPAAVVTNGATGVTLGGTFYPGNAQSAYQIVNGGQNVLVPATTNYVTNIVVTAFDTNVIYGHDFDLWQFNTNLTLVGDWSTGFYANDNGAVVKPLPGAHLSTMETVLIMPGPMTGRLSAWPRRMVSSARCSGAPTSAPAPSAISRTAPTAWRPTLLLWPVTMLVRRFPAITGFWPRTALLLWDRV